MPHALRRVWQPEKPFAFSTKFTLADGLAVAKAGDLTLSIMRQLKHKMVSIDEEWLALAMLRLAELEIALSKVRVL
jgi:threonine dehydratase